MSQRTLTLSAEEAFEVRQALEANIKREQAALGRMRELLAMNGSSGIIERAERSLNVLASVLRKL